MFRKTRKVPGLSLVVVILALALAACGDNTATPNAPAATTAATSATTAAATTVAATTAATSATTAAANATTAAAGATTAAAGAGPKATSVACDKPVAAASSGKTYKIGIAVQNTIPDLQSAIDGAKKGLEQCGFVSGKNVTFLDRNAAGDIPALATIGKEFADNKVDAMLAVGSQALTNLYNTNKDNGIPLIFNAVTDPYRVLPSVIKSATDHGPITGMQALPPVEDGLKIVVETIPAAKNIGFIYNPAEVNAVATLDEAQKLAKTMNLTIVTVTVQNSGEVLTAAQSIADKVDAFLTTTDVTVVNNLESVVKVAIDNKKPLFALNPDSASRGAVVAVGLDYYDNGFASAAYIAQVLDGKKSDTLEIKRQPKGPTRVNTKAAEQMGVKIPDSILNRADQKYTEITPPKK